MESPFLSIDCEVRARAVDVNESDEQDRHRNFCPSDHIRGKLRKAVGLRTTNLASTMRRGWGSDRLVDGTDGLANNVFCCRNQ